MNEYKTELSVASKKFKSFGAIDTPEHTATQLRNYLFSSINVFGMSEKAS